MVNTLSLNGWTVYFEIINRDQVRVYNVTRKGESRVVTDYDAKGFAKMLMDLTVASQQEENILPDKFKRRLTFDPNISERSPVIYGTWITSDHVISLINDGWKWDDILISHPEITEDDIKMCLAYQSWRDS